MYSVLMRSENRMHSDISDALKGEFMNRNSTDCGWREERGEAFCYGTLCWMSGEEGVSPLPIFG
jgi:hypothetical protein